MCKNILQNVPEYYLEPLMLIARYFLKVNYSVGDYNEYKKNFIIKAQRYEKYYQKDDIVQENLYQNTNIVLMISDQKGDSGKIVFFW